MEKKDHGTLGAYIDLFLRRKLLFLAIFAVLFGVLGAGALSVKSSYRARSLLAIGESEPLGLLHSGVQARNRAKPASASLSGKTYATIVQGLPMSAAVADRLSSDSLQVSGEFIHRAVSAEFFEPEVLEIRATAKDPEHAKVIANAAAMEFVEYNREQIRSEMQESANFVLRELEQVSHELASINNEINEFKEREQVTDLDVEVEELLGAVVQFEKDKRKAEADRAEQAARRDEIEAMLFGQTDVAMSPLENPSVRALSERYGELSGELEIARAEYGPDHPRRQLLERQVERARSQLEAAAAEPIPGTAVTESAYYTALRSNLTQTLVALTGLDARIGALQRAIDQGRQQLSALPPKQFELRGLQLRESVTEDKYRRLLERLEEMEVEIEGIQGNATILDLAVRARPAVSRAMLLIYVALLSLLGAVAGVLTIEYRDNTIKSPEIISNVLQMTNFGFVPRIQGMGRKWFAEESLHDHAFEHYRKLRANVRFSSVKKPIRCMMVTSSSPGEGKSSTIANLAVALAQMDQKILLVDTDLRRPNIWRLFEVETSPGVTDVLTGQRALSEVIKSSGIPNLDLLTSGPIPPNPAELFESEQMDALVETLREHSGYDMVLFDSAPTLLTTDTPVLAAKMDGVLVVLEAGRTTEEQGLMTKEMLTNSGARVLGAVLNKARSSSSGYYYYGAGQNGDRRPSSNGGFMGSLKNLGEKIGIGG